MLMFHPVMLIFLIKDADFPSIHVNFPLIPMVIFQWLESTNYSDFPSIAGWSFSFS